MQRSKKRFVLVLIVLTATLGIVSLVIWHCPQKISADLISGEIYIGKIHFFVSYDDPENPYVGTPDLNVQGTTINRSSGNYQTILRMLGEISYSNCFHTAFKPEDTHGKYDNLIRVSWTNADGSPFDLYFFEGSSHIRINNTYYRLITPSNPYKEWEKVVK